MNLFQGLTLPVLGLVLVWELVNLFRRATNRPVRLLRCAVWLAAMVAIANPDLTSAAAASVGVTRGTDLVLYVFVLAFLVLSFYFYSRYVKLQRQLTDVVRHIAVEQAKRVPSEPSR